MANIYTKFISRRLAETISSIAEKDTVQAYRFADIPFGHKVALVSMVSPYGFGGAEVTKPVLENFWSHVHYAVFDDVDHHTTYYQIISWKDATNIVNFIDSVKNEVDAIWCHCEAGISRSAAVSKFIADTNNAYFPESYSFYNKYVYDILMKVHNNANYQQYL
jgi:hypothetical protein